MFVRESTGFHVYEFNGIRITHQNQEGEEPSSLGIKIWFFMLYIRRKRRWRKVGKNMVSEELSSR
jgi:hypothetical protein